MINCCGGCQANLQLGKTTRRHIAQYFVTDGETPMRSYLIAAGLASLLITAWIALVQVIA
jgi:hypothetical protein